MKNSRKISSILAITLSAGVIFAFQNCSDFQAYESTGKPVAVDNSSLNQVDDTSDEQHSITPIIDPTKKNRKWNM